jgi:opacity protein-like surface antigen
MKKGVLGFAVIALLLGMPPALSEAEAASPRPDWDLDIYTGYYSPRPDAIDGSLTFGVRVGRRVTERLVVSLDIMRWMTNVDLDTSSGRESVDLNATFFDLPVTMLFRPAEKVGAAVFGGPGWAFVDAAVVGDLQVQRIDEDSFTLHAGAGVDFRLTQMVYLALEGRLRWFDDREEEKVDQELILGLRFRVGR